MAADLGLVTVVSEDTASLIFRAKYFKEGFFIIRPNTQILWNGTLFKVPVPYCSVEF